MPGTRAKRAAAFDRDPASSIGYLIRDGARLIHEQLAGRLEPHGMTVGHYFVLRELYRNEGLSQRELCARIGIGEASAVATLDAMEARGLVARVRDADDRRKIRLSLTPRSRALRRTLLADAARIINTATAGFSPEEVETLRALLRRLNAALQANAAPAAATTRST